MWEKEEEVGTESKLAVAVKVRERQKNQRKMRRWDSGIVSIH